MKFTPLVIVTLWLAACSQSIPYKTAPLPVGTLLYVKPISMAGKLSSRIEVDFTARLTHNDSAGAVLNFSLITARPVSKIGRIQLSNGTTSLSNTDQVQKLFVEQQGNHWVSRFSAKLTIAEFMNIIKSPSFQLIASTDTDQYVYPSDNAWTGKSQQISDYIIANQ